MKHIAFKPVVTIVGRANVGKSTLFNRLTRSRQALVADFPGLTRDRHYGEGRMGSRPYLIVDTGGFEPVVKDGIVREMARQTEQAIAESDVIIFLVDAREGLNRLDFDIANLLRRSGQPVLLAINKAEGMRYGTAGLEFHELGLGEAHLISASHGDGVGELIEAALAHIPEPEIEEEPEFDPDAPDEPFRHRIKLAVVGRPNVGKSTFINALMGEERVIAFDQPGTTRDAIEIEFDYKGTPYTLIDTAGLRKRGKVFETIEKFSVIKTLQAVEAANVVLLMLDASSEISDQDASIAGFVLETGRAVVIAINKWDDVDSYRREWAKREYARKLRFLDFAKVQTISALKGQGINHVMRAVKSAHAAAFRRLPTPKLTRVIHDAVEQQQPPRKGIFRPKMRYAHQGGQNPPIVIVHGSGLDGVSDSYKRYLEGKVREAFDLEGTPMRVELKSSRNPYAQEK